MPGAPQQDDAATQLAELAKRHAALRQAASLPGVDVGSLLEAAFAELEVAIGLLAAPLGTDDQVDAGATGGSEATERRMLRAAFTDAPVPLFLLAKDGTVLRAREGRGRAARIQAWLRDRQALHHVRRPLRARRGADAAQRRCQDRQVRPGQGRLARQHRASAQGTGHRPGQPQR